jgi:hypothetical protein
LQHDQAAAYVGRIYLSGCPKIGAHFCYEWDNTSLEYNEVQVWSRETAKIPYLPREELTVVMDGRPVDENGQQGLAQAVYFESDAGAKVFSAGTIRWAWGLGKPGFKEDRFLRLNENLLAGFLATPKQSLN